MSYRIRHGYQKDEDAWYDLASGPNRYRHRVRICCESARLDILNSDGRAVPAKASTYPMRCGAFPRTSAVYLSNRSSRSCRRPTAPTIQRTPRRPITASTTAWASAGLPVHPNGDSEAGHPVKLKLNSDGSPAIVGSAGGALNGLRMTAVKSPAEYRKHATAKPRTSAPGCSSRKRNRGKQCIDRCWPCSSCSRERSSRWRTCMSRRIVSISSGMSRRAPVAVPRIVRPRLPRRHHRRWSPSTNHCAPRWSRQR
jgi:hypothetical protein